MKNAPKKTASRGVAARKPVASAKAKAPSPRAGAVKKKAAPGTDHVLLELKSLAKELNKAAKGLGNKGSPANPKDISAILGNVERMTADAANKSLSEAELAKQILTAVKGSLSHDWSRKEIDEALHGISGHLTNIIIAQEFQDLAGQAIRKAMKLLVGAIVVETVVSADDKKLSQSEVDSVLKELMP